MFCGQEEMYLTQLKVRYQPTQESIQDFSQAISFISQLSEHLRDREIRSAVHLTQPSTMEEAVRSALQTEAFLATERQRQLKHVKSTRNVETSEGDKTSEILSLLRHIVEKQDEKSNKGTRKSPREPDQGESIPPPGYGE